MILYLKKKKSIAFRHSNHWNTK